MSTLSRGPVAPSDKIGLADVGLILRSCAADGRLLRPDRPAVQIDAVLMSESGILPDNPKGQIWATSVKLSQAIPHYTIVLSVDASAIRVDAKLLGYSVGARVVGWADGGPLTAVVDVSRHGVQIPVSSRRDFKLWHFAPVLLNGWAFMGEARTKWVPFSRDRIKNVRITDTQAVFTLVGPAGEKLTLQAADPSLKVHTVECIVSDAGEVDVTLPELICN